MEFDFCAISAKIPLLFEADHVGLPPDPSTFYAPKTMSAIIQKIEEEQLKDVADFNVGDTVKVHTRVVEGGKERIQIFAGIVIGKKGQGLNTSFTVRKISYGEGVERVFPVHTPRIAKIEVTHRGKVRRARLNYLRGRVGKQAMNVKSANRA